MGCHFLLQGIFLDQGSSPQLLHWQTDSLPLSHQGSSQDFSPSNNTNLLWGGGDHLLGVGIRAHWNGSWKMLALYIEKCGGAQINPTIHKWIAWLSFPSWGWGELLCIMNSPCFCQIHLQEAGRAENQCKENCCFETWGTFPLKTLLTFLCLKIFA